MAAGAFWLVFALSVARSENDESVDSLLVLESGSIQRLPQLPPFLPWTWNHLIPVQSCVENREAGDDPKLEGIGLAGGFCAPVRRGDGGKSQ